MAAFPGSVPVTSRRARVSRHFSWKEIPDWLAKLRHHEPWHLSRLVSEGRQSYRCVEATFSIALVFEDEEEIEDKSGKSHKLANLESAILHGAIKRKCYFAYAKYQYKAWVTLNGKRYAVDEISARMNSGNGNFKKK